MSSARPLRRWRRGMAAVEFGLLAPVLVLVLMASADLVATMRAQIRVETVATQIGHIASQCQTLTSPGDTQHLFAHGQRLVGSLGVVTGPTTAGAIVITAVYRVGSTNRIAWQVRDGSATFASSVGSSVRDSEATVAGDYVVPPGQTLIVTEIFLNRNAWVLSSGFFGTSGLATAQAAKLYLTRASDAAAISAVPSSTDALGCFA